MSWLVWSRFANSIFFFCTALRTNCANFRCDLFIIQFVNSQPFFGINQPLCCAFFSSPKQIRQLAINDDWFHTSPFTGKLKYSYFAFSLRFDFYCYLISINIYTGGNRTTLLTTNRFVCLIWTENWWTFEIETLLIYCHLRFTLLRLYHIFSIINIRSM